MTKSQRDEYDARKALQDHGWLVRKRDPTNTGSESAKHMAVKGIVASVGADLGYRSNLEVVNETGNMEIDVLLYGNPERLTYAVEVENSLTTETKKDKLKYVGGPINDIVIIDLDELGMDITEIEEHIKNELTYDQ